LETIKLILGDLAGPLPSESLLEQKFTQSGAAPSPDIMVLRGRRIVWASETGKGRNLNLEKVKWLVGDDRITGRHVYGKRQIEFAPTHTLFLLTNHKPHLKDNNTAMDRLCLIPFELSFVDEPHATNERKKDGELKDKLMKEAPGILAWLVKGCLLYQRQGLNRPHIIKQATQEYRNEEDIYAQFIEEYCNKLLDGRVRAFEFFKAYEQWCGQNGYKPDESTDFGIKMKRIFKNERDNKGVYYRGVQLKSYWHILQGIPYSMNLLDIAP
jgi:putative DNA primase/helicase